MEYLLGRNIPASDIGLGIRINQQNNRKVFAKKVGIKKVVSLPLISNVFKNEVDEIFDELTFEFDRNEKRIAIVDDNKDMLKILVSNLESKDYIIDTFSSSANAIHSIENKKYDIIISDYYMPEGNGDKVFKAYCKNRKDKSLFIMMTGDLYNIPNEIIKEIIVLDKPINFVGLQNLINNYLKVEKKKTQETRKTLEYKRPKILLVDDQEENYILLNAYLNKIDCELIYINSPSEALSRLKEESFDLIFLDMHMPIIDGYDCARSIRNLGVSTKIIALSANSLKFEIDKAKKFGCDEYVIKPVTKNTIIEKVNKLILA